MSINGTVKLNPGCFGLNNSQSVKKNKNGSYQMVLGVFGTPNRAGAMVPKLSDEIIDNYNNREEMRRVMLFRSIGVDSIRGDAISTLMRNALSDTCGLISNVSVVTEPTRQVLVGNVELMGPKAMNLRSLLEDLEYNTVTVGHRLIVDGPRDDDGKHILKKLKTVDIVGFDVICNAV